MAHLSEVVDGRGHHVDAAGAAGGGTEGGAQGGAQGGAEAPAQTGETHQGQGATAGQLQASQPPPMPSRSAPCLNDIQNDSVKPYVTEIGTELGLIKKHISAALYRVKKLDELIPQINKSLAEKQVTTSMLTSTS